MYLFLCSAEPNEILATLKPQWNEKTRNSLKDKLSILHFQLSSVFPWENELSAGIDYEKFLESFFIQPDLFLRIRPGNEERVKQKLIRTGIEFETISSTCLAIANTSKIDEVIELDKEAVVQDYSSQRVMELFPVRPGKSVFPVRPGRSVFPVRQHPVRPGRSDRVWDCCAGSGGKSIMAFDLNADIELTVSDVRESILANLKKRFKKAGIKKYHSFITDLTHSPLTPGGFRDPGSPFEIIIADMPCTGSGTWSRTPEQKYFFKPEKIDEYASLQRKILANVIPYINSGGYLLYITCSVFRKENEAIIDYGKENFNLQILNMELLSGYDKKADTMFAALLQKEL